jgi:hypothetical protein
MYVRDDTSKLLEALPLIITTSTLDLVMGKAATILSRQPTSMVVLETKQNKIKSIKKLRYTLRFVALFLTCVHSV